MNDAPAAEALVATLCEAVALMGPRFDPTVLAATRALYRSHVPPAGDGGIRCIADVRWGDEPSQSLDLFMPPDAAGAPVIVFVHGGGFVAGSKNEDGCFHRNVGEYFARHGFVTVVPDYRLAPQHTWPAGAQDVGGILGWIDREIEAHGGDPGAVVAVAQSAGASHVATWIFDDEVRAGARSTLRAAALLSGFYRVTPSSSAGAISYFGADVEQHARRSVAANLHERHPPLLLTLAEFDPERIASQTLDLAEGLGSIDGPPVRLVRLEGHNHVSTVLSLGTPQDDVGRLLVDFVRRNLPVAALRVEAELPLAASTIR